MYKKIKNIPIGKCFVDIKFGYLFKLSEVKYGKAITIDGKRYLPSYSQNEITYPTQIREATEFEIRWLDECILAGEWVTPTKISPEPQYEIY